MENRIIMVRDQTSHVRNIPVSCNVKKRWISETYLCEKFGLVMGSISKITYMGSEYGCMEIEILEEGKHEFVNGIKTWCLARGEKYHLFMKDDVRDPSICDLPHGKREVDVKGKGKVDVTILSGSSGASLRADVCAMSAQDLSSDSSLRADLLGVSAQDCLPRVEVSLNKGPVATLDVQESQAVFYPVNALDLILKVSGSSQVARFIKTFKYDVKHVRTLPPDYNGNIIFELPPVFGSSKKGQRLQGMDGANDCYFWNRIAPTTVRVPSKLYEFGKVRCLGSIECRNNLCDYFKQNGTRNLNAWKGVWITTIIQKVGETLPGRSVVYGFCNEPAFCLARCEVEMRYMYLDIDLDEKLTKQMSRLAIHMGTHKHPCRSVFGRESMNKVKKLIEKHHSIDHAVSPAHLKNLTSRILLSELVDIESRVDIGSEEELKVWESLKVVASPEKFAALLRSVRLDSPLKMDLEWLMQMKQHIRFPYLHRYLFPGQASRSDSCHVFKMSTKGSGLGLDLLQRMKPGGSLEGVWVSFDVMHRTTKGWLTFSAHVYDHNYRALCTIFTCELRSEDADALEVAWRLMIDVARENGLVDVHIHGFMADNAIAGWSAVMNVFLNGLPDASRERFDAFHWHLSLRKHTLEGIVEGKYEEHYQMWGQLRNCTTIIESYKVSNLRLVDSGKCIQ